jgi:hypothetical protein
LESGSSSERNKTSNLSIGTLSAACPGTIQSAKLKERRSPKKAEARLYGQIVARAVGLGCSTFGVSGDIHGVVGPRKPRLVQGQVPCGDLQRDGEFREPARSSIVVKERSRRTAERCGGLDRTDPRILIAAIWREIFTPDLAGNRICTTHSGNERKETIELCGNRTRLDRTLPLPLNPCGP